MTDELSPALGYLCFIVLTAAFLVLAFGPSWLEWLRPSDTAALRVLPNYSSDIDHFSDRFRADVQEHLRSPQLHLVDHFELVGAQVRRVDWRGALRPVIALGDLSTDQAIECPTQVFVHGDLTAGAGSEFDALLVEGALRLGARSAVRSWAHADGKVLLEQGCKVTRRVSSMESVTLAPDCCFERVQAPDVNFGQVGQVRGVSNRRPRRQALLSELQGAIRQTEHLTLIRGDCRLAQDTRYVGSLIVTGRLLIGAGSEVVGDVKARDGIVVGAEARLDGSLTSEKQIQILEGATVAGPVISETIILVGAQVRLGRHDAPTTVSADSILVEGGAHAHGTVWARNMGVVWAA